jgi:hypothetical protein
MKFRFTQLLTICLLLAGTVPASANEVLKVLYEAREPLFYRDTLGKLTGLVYSPVEQALRAANIPVEWVETPFKRQLAVVEANYEAVCALGLFKTKERLRYAKFSQAVFKDTDRPSVILAHRDFTFEKHLDLHQVMSLPGARILKKENASYGIFIDDVIERSRITIIPTTAKSVSMAKMIAARRADFFLVSEDEAQRLIKHIPNGEQLYIYKPGGMPDGPERFLVCSKMVSDETLNRFNKALK